MKGDSNRSGSSNTTSWTRHPIGWDDVVVVQGRHLVKQATGEPFLLQGVAFPTIVSADVEYDADGWIAVLEQLANLTQINAVRVYRMDCAPQHKHHKFFRKEDTFPNGGAAAATATATPRVLPDYTSFLERAAELGIYAIVPLTAPIGDGVLDRTKAAPRCYNRTLYEYGVSCLNRLYLRHPNVLAGVVGNEVMNTLDAWHAAPCVTAYGKDLKRYMAHLKEEAAVKALQPVTTTSPTTTTTNNTMLQQERYPLRRTHLPLLYAAQHDSPEAEILTETAMKLTADYLSCTDDADDQVAEAAVDIFGINVESWCSSLQTFEQNEDGTPSGYYLLWKALENATIPIIFSEMGCSKTLFNRDNGLLRYVRDWAQVPVVLRQMRDRFAGFFAYAYSGNPDFIMMKGAEVWDGHHVLKPAQDFDNFAAQLAAYHANETAKTSPASATTTANNNYTTAPPLPITCRGARANLERTYNVTLRSQLRMPQYSHAHLFSATEWILLIAISCAAGVVALWGYRVRPWRRRSDQNGGQQYDNLSTAATVMTNYQSVSEHD